MCRASSSDAPSQFFKLVVRHYYITGRPFTRDKVVWSHFVYYITRSCAARMMCRASSSDAPTQFFKLVVRHYYIAGTPFTRDKVVWSHFVYSNSYITRSYAATRMCRASALDAPAQFLKPLVKPGNVLLTNCRMSTADRIYLVKTDPHRKPDVIGVTFRAKVTRHGP